ncbi:BatD family protein [Methylicorpusculum sp.]|uniref:BatD family protein n=2 Tax=Methylicorpusculum sp. TaxID=2713644 RepID=UPI0027638EC1|nr:BatD family protein [Methylicorpusculum sp.]MDP3528437.1 BatD family protein [Methylicorpusculum sp.]MDZ4152952.1 BatD family protein [Methylicorpusculum sp.]
MFITKTCRNGCLVLALLMSLTGTVFAVEIEVSVDRNPVTLNESFQLLFTANESPDGRPDFSPLETDFEILGQSQSSSTSIINGQFSKKIQWKVDVIAKSSGDLVIPAISFGNDKTGPFPLTVNDKTIVRSVPGDDEIFLEVEATPEKPYVQSQVLYTLRFFRRVDIAQARLNEPEMDDAVIEKMGEDSNYSTQINGVDYTVTERRYAIFTQKSGIVTIKPLTLDAEVLVTGRPRFNGFFSRQMTKTKRVSSKAVTLDVQPLPQNFKAQHWLPAEAVSLSQSWSGDISQMKVGEPVTRTLTLLVKGAAVGQLPELNNAIDQENVKTYPDQPVLREEKKPEGMMAFREEKIAFIPSKEGTFELPAIDIPWFNVITGKLEVAKIPAAVINVLSASGSQTQDVPSGTEAIANSIEPLNPAQAPSVVQSPYWMWLAVFFGLAWLTTLGYLLIKRKPVPADSLLEADAKTASERESLKVLKKACAENDPQAAKEALLVWGRIKFQVSSLGQLASFCDARLRDEIDTLNRCLYGKEEVIWVGKRLFQAFSENQARKQLKVEKDNGLEPLYRL